MLFQTETDDGWYALDLVGCQGTYPVVDSLPGGAISDGRWHRVTWNFRQVFKQQMVASGRPRIRNLILESWTKHEKPIRVEFRDLVIGWRNNPD